MVYRILALALIWMGWLCPVVGRAQTSLLMDMSFWSKTQMLEPGQSRFGVESFFRSSSTQLNSSGRRESLGEPYRHTLNWEKALASMKEEADHLEVRSFLKDQGINPLSTVAVQEFEVHRQELGLAPTWGYGLTRKWSLEVRLPIVQTRTEVQTKTQISMGPISSLGKKMTLSPKAQEALLQSAQKALQTELDQLEYNSPQTVEENMQVGDLEVVNKFLLSKGQRISWLLLQGLTIPLANRRDPYSFVDTSYGDGQVDIGLGSVVDWATTRRTGLRLSVGHKVQMADQIEMRIPRVGEPQWKGEIDPEVHRDLGDVSWGSLEARYKWNRWLQLNSGYSYQIKGKDKLEGHRFSKEQYSTLSEGTAVEQQVAHLGIGYQALLASTYTSYKKVIDASLGVYAVVLGRNVAEAPVTTLKLAYSY